MNCTLALMCNNWVEFIRKKNDGVSDLLYAIVEVSWVFLQRLSAEENLWKISAKYTKWYKKENVLRQCYPEQRQR